jgi:Flp pilus assembly protein TadG
MRLRAPRPRRAVTLVETAFVLSIALLFLFGLFEYARFVHMQQVCYNAALDGARFAAAHTGDGTTLAQVQSEVQARMASRDAQVGGYAVTVNNVTPSTGVPVPNTSWNDAPFGGAILVTVSGTYTPWLPTFLFEPPSIAISARAMVTSEAN